MSNFLRELLNEILQYIVLESKKKEGFSMNPIIDHMIDNGVLL